MKKAQLFCSELDSIVTPAGFKPATAGAEIQCAIQLRHEAISGKIRIYYNNNLFFS